MTGRSSGEMDGRQRKLASADWLELDLTQNLNVIYLMYIYFTILHGWHESRDSSFNYTRP